MITQGSKKNGYLNYGELLIKGKSKKEILISTYICHPSMDNNELSGLIVCMSLINYFKKQKLEKSIRFLFIPETIGSIAYLNKTKCDSLPISLPPLKEQKVIVKKVNALMGLCDTLEQEVRQGQAYSEQLMQSVLKEVFEPNNVN